MKRKMKKSLLMILFSVASMYAQDSAAPNQAQGVKTTSDTKTAKTTTKGAKNTKTTAPASASQAAFGIASSIPKDAQPLDHGRYRAVDEGGVAWIYQSTPFGITKTRESELQQPTAGQSSPFGGPMKTREAASTPQDSPTASTVTAFPNGDEIRFEKQTPFGKSGWTKKRTEQLNSVEKNALANAEKTTASSGKN
jgi:hypothetical protein